MNSDFLDDEMRALLSAYSMGTLSGAERQRLFEKALGNQELFNQLADEETLRATFESPLVKRALNNALSQAKLPLRDVAAAASPAPLEEIRPSRWPLYTAAACVVLASLGLYTFLQPKAQPAVEIAQAPAPQTLRKLESAAPAAATPVSPAPLASKPANPRPDPPATRPGQGAPTLPAPLPLDERLASPSPAPPPPPAVAPPPAPTAADNLVLALRDEAKEAKSEAASEFRAKAVARQAAVSAPLRVSGRQIFVEAPRVGHLYAFRRDPSGFVKVLSAPINADSPRSFPLAPGTIHAFLAPAADPELDRLEKVEILPVRMWSVLTLN